MNIVYGICNMTVVKFIDKFQQTFLFNLGLKIKKQTKTGSNHNKQNYEVTRSLLPPESLAVKRFGTFSRTGKTS